MREGGLQMPSWKSTVSMTNIWCSTVRTIIIFSQKISEGAYERDRETTPIKGFLVLRCGVRGAGYGRGAHIQYPGKKLGVRTINEPEVVVLDNSVVVFLLRIGSYTPESSINSRQRS